MPRRVRTRLTTNAQAQEVYRVETQDTENGSTYTPVRDFALEDFQAMCSYVDSKFLVTNNLVTDQEVWLRVI